MIIGPNQPNLVRFSLSILRLYVRKTVSLVAALMLALEPISHFVASPASLNNHAVPLFHCSLGCYSDAREIRRMLTGACHCGGVTWTHSGAPNQATACSCTSCRRYGVLWIYGHEGETIKVTGPLSAYRRSDLEDPVLTFNFCPNCGCVVCWRGEKTDQDGRRKMAVNVRLSEPDTVAHLPIRHFDGHDRWAAVEGHGNTVKDMWF